MELVVDYLSLQDRLARVLSIVKSYYSWGMENSVGVASGIIRQEDLAARLSYSHFCCILGPFNTGSSFHADLESYRRSR